jgi:hypothetical protein
MADEKTKRSSISVTPDDVKLLRSLRVKLKAEHGKLTFAGIVRVCLRKVASQ